MGEHLELHAIWSVLTGNKIGYSRHPESLRWSGHLPALRARHDAQVVEMEMRGWKHTSELSEVIGECLFPKPFDDIHGKLFEKLKRRLGHG